MDSTLEPLGDIWKYNPDYNRAADFLGIDKYSREDVKIAQKLSSITDWANSQNKNTDLGKALLKINSLKKELGLNTQGEALLGQLYEYIRVKTNADAPQSQPKFEEAMNQMIEEHRAKRQESREFSVVKDKKQLERKTVQEQKRTEKAIEQTMQDYRKSFKPEPKENIPVRGLIDHTPIPSQYVGRSIGHVD